MNDPATLAFFVLASLALLATPGPAVLYIVARSIDQGRLAGVVSMLGVHLGSLVHVLAAALGLSALVLSSAIAFTAIKYLGAAYLIWLGVRKLLGRDGARTAVPLARRGHRRLLVEGMIVNVLNPKTALFFLAFLPQFVDPALGGVVGQFVFFGCLFVALGVASDGLYALGAGSARQLLRGSERFRRIDRYLTGSVFVGLGVATALAGDGRK